MHGLPVHGLAQVWTPLPPDVVGAILCAFGIVFCWRSNSGKGCRPPPSLARAGPAGTARQSPHSSRSSRRRPNQPSPAQAGGGRAPSVVVGALRQARGTRPEGAERSISLEGCGRSLGQPSNHFDRPDTGIVSCEINLTRFIHLLTTDNILPQPSNKETLEDWHVCNAVNN